MSFAIIDRRVVKNEEKGQDRSYFSVLTVVTASWLTWKLTVEVAVAMGGTV